MSPRQRDLYYLKIAHEVSRAGTCLRRQVGALVVSPQRRLAAGFNGAPSRAKECQEIGCLVVDEHCIRTVHAEINALIIAGSDAQGGTVYSTCEPCWECTKVLVNAGVRRIVYYASDYRDTRGDVARDALLADANVQTMCYPHPL